MRDKTPKTVTYKGTKYKVRYATGSGTDGKPCFVCVTDKLFGTYGDELPLAEFEAATGLKGESRPYYGGGKPTGKGV